MNFKTSLAIQNLTLYKNKIKILDDISLELKEGNLISIIGPTGAGKTSLLRTILQFEKINDGSIRIFQKDMKKLKLNELAKNISFVHQSSFLPVGLLVNKYVLFGRNPHLGFFDTESKIDYKIVEQALKKVDSLQFIDRELTTLSGGEQRLIIIARAIAQQTPIMVLDEPAANLDFALSAKIMNILKNIAVKERKTVLIATHDVNNAIRFSDYMCLLKHGRIIKQGTPSEVMNNENIMDLYGASAQITKDIDGNTIVSTKYN
ncbi:MAG: iron complex transport system ATP-binding protein [Chloroflexi bacterium]|jgi:iron complex transport system ATP-binding protein|nr:MAG: iron complex transport system ATP-binding protein [Chloroflexota bacterium]